MLKNATNNPLEIRIAHVSILASLVCYVGVFHFIVMRIVAAFVSGHHALLAEDIVFLCAMGFMAYGTLLYQICLAGYYKRRKNYVPATRDAMEKIYAGKSPSLSILIPSYKEEHAVVWQTMVSAALAEYPEKNVVLLIDDPYRPKNTEDLFKLEETRRIPAELQAQFSGICARFRLELDAFHERKNKDVLYQGVELNRISMLYDEAAHWLGELARTFIGGRAYSALTHTDRFFVENIIATPAWQHKQLARELRHRISEDKGLDTAFLERHYGRLAGLFNVNFSSFERKKYSNLSHEANKAMNLNSYIAVMGKAWKEVAVRDGVELQPAASHQEADICFPYSDYVNTIDADSLMLPDYLIRMTEIMEREENKRLAVIQSTVSSVPDSPNLLERTAGMCLDLQFMNHQGFTHWGATFWVGANAMLRYRALAEIRETKIEDGKEVAVYIQDRTVIEDTESTVDLVEKGWKLYNYPERLSYSAMPTDFGSLLIQRRRWANGGMVILPKLLRYVAKAPKSVALFKEFFMRFHYLAATTLSCILIAGMSFYRFGDDLSTFWIILSTIPAGLLYIRALIVSGYRFSDIFRISAINLMLIPVLFGGVFKQFQQMLTGKKIPFGRTPKVTGRTASPAIYCFVEVVMAVGFFSACLNDVLQHNWYHAIFTAFNSACMVYALVYFMGIDETCQDMFAGIAHSWEALLSRYEVVMLAAVRRVRRAVSANLLPV